MKNQLFIEKDLEKFEEILNNSEGKKRLKYFSKHLLSRFNKCITKDREDLERLFIYYELKDRRKEFISYQDKIRSIFSKLWVNNEIGLLSYNYESDTFDSEWIIHYDFKDWLELDGFLVANIRKRLWTKGYYYSIGSYCIMYIAHDLELLAYILKGKEEYAKPIFNLFNSNGFYIQNLDVGSL